MLIDIENMAYADLKAKRAELIEEAKVAPIEELAARYVQARTDAKMRDEKMAEQGKTITALQDALETEKRRAAEAEKLKAAVQAMAKELQEAKAEGVKLRALAKSRRQAVAAVVQMLSPVLVDEA